MNWKDVILPEFEIRKTAAQKEAFIEKLRSVYGDKMTVERAGKAPVSRNIILGDPESAKIVFTAHYDTCPRLPFPNFITPKNFLVFILWQILLCVVMLIPAFGLTTLVSFLCRELPESVGLVLAEVTMFAVIGFELWWMLAGPENRHTANDNTSGVVTVLTLADTIGFSECAYILFDNEEVGLLGSAAYAKAHPKVKNDTLIVNLDCVSDGDYMLMSFSKTARETSFYRSVSDNAEAVLGEYGKTPVVTSSSTTIYPSDQAAFKKSAAVAAMNKARFIGLYMDKIHTPKDTVFMEDNIVSLVKLFERAVKKAENDEKAPK